MTSPKPLDPVALSEAVCAGELAYGHGATVAKIVEAAIRAYEAAKCEPGTIEFPSLTMLMAIPRELFALAYCLVENPSIPKARLHGQRKEWSRAEVIERMKACVPKELPTPPEADHDRA